MVTIRESVGFAFIAACAVAIGWGMQAKGQMNPLNLTWMVCDALGAALFVYAANGDRPLCGWLAMRLVALGTMLLELAVYTGAA